MKCCIVYDLLASYVDGLCSEETNAEIRKHLDECADCRSVYEKMSADIFWDMPQADKNIDFLKKLKAKMLRTNIMIAAFAGLAVLILFFIFAMDYQIPLPFDESHMTAEMFTVAKVSNQRGETLWRDVDELDDSQTVYEEPTSRLVIPEHYETGEMVRVGYQYVNNLSACVRRREMNRDGQVVEVIYYCYYKSLWDIVRPDGAFFTGYHESGSFNVGRADEEPSGNGDYQPKVREIYYVPIKNLWETDNLSDQEFDNLKEKGRLVWSGLV